RFVVHALRRLSLVRVSPGVGWWETTWPPIQSPYCAIAFRRPGIPARGGLAGWRGPGGSGGARRRPGGLAGFGRIRAAFGNPGGLAGLGGFGAGPRDPSGPGGVPEGLALGRVLRLWSMVPGQRHFWSGENNRGQFRTAATPPRQPAGQPAEPAIFRPPRQPAG